MCEVTDEQSNFEAQGVYNNGIIQVNATPGVCPDCGVLLTADHMWPSGGCSRSLCTNCFNRRIAGETHICQECRVADITHKIPMQRSQPREMYHHRICDDIMCKASAALRHTIVTGRSREECMGQVQQAQIGYQQPMPQFNFNMLTPTPQHSIAAHDGYGQQNVTAQEVALVQKVLAAYENRYNYNTLPAERIVAGIIQQIRRDPSFFDTDVMDAEWVDNVRSLPPPAPQMTVDGLMQSVRHRQPQHVNARYVELPKKSRANRSGAVYVELPKKGKLGFLR